jgi:hypothetical protein
VRIGRLGVRGPLVTGAAPGRRARLGTWSNGHLTTGAAVMADLAFVILTVVFFAGMALVLKGVERL